MRRTFRNQPVIADKNPAVMELEAGTYYWCSCGKSKNQSFCDGSHSKQDLHRDNGKYSILDTEIPPTPLI
ncbi:MAG: CDGSH iron-sulfur domain-containing protein [Rivularia sp. (in: cyanobacteria)]